MSQLDAAPIFPWPTASRVALPTDRAQVLSTLLLLGMGAVATLAAMMEFKLRLPGNSILRPVLPMVLGLALVPRRGAGSTMTVGSIGTLIIARLLGQEKGLGGMTSLILLGPALDLALLHAKANWLLYARFALAGLAANGLAFLVQMTAKSLGFSLGGGKDFRSWISLATLTYPLFGLIAGLVSGLLLFHWSPLGRARKGDDKPQP